MKSYRRLATLALTVLAASLRAWGAETEILWLSGHGPDDAVRWEFTVSHGRRAGEAATLPVPSHWELHGFGTLYYGHQTNRPPEQGRYARWFELPAGWRGRRIVLRFDGVMTDTAVTLNGRPAGPPHQGGFYPFEYDVTDLVRWNASNRLEVTVNKVSANPTVEAAERRADYWVFGGIYRPVRLEARPDPHIEHLALRAEAEGNFEATLRIRGDLARASLASLTVLAPAGEVAATLTAPVEPPGTGVTLRTRVEAPATWSAETPVLYTAIAELFQGSNRLHRLRRRFGFRTFEVRPGAGLFLNGRRILLKGVCRHSFRAASGRCLSPAQNIADVRRIRSLNFNAVRCVHYPPDESFLDACDELGLYVLDELAGWQTPPYDTETGRRLVRAMVERDAHHPSVLFWDNGNEGGWNAELDPEFARHDPYARPVLHPWAKFSGVDTDHYEPYRSVVAKLRDDSHVFLPTEHLHGLFDGGGGAGLEDHWALMCESRNAGGLFLWAFADEAVARPDRNGALDCDGFHGPDGIVGPHHEPEGSAATVRSVFSPVRLIAPPPGPLPEGYAARVVVSNAFSFLDLSALSFTWRLDQFGPGGPRCVTGRLTRAFAAPGTCATLAIPLPTGWRSFDRLALTASGPDNVEIQTWAWPVRPPETSLPVPPAASAPAITEHGGRIEIAAGGCRYHLRRSDGRLCALVANGVELPLANGPRAVPAPAASDLQRTVSVAALGAVVEVRSESGVAEAGSWIWTFFGDGSAALEFSAKPPAGELPFLGLTFDWPESEMRAVRWLGLGPFRVWKNRMTGPVWGEYELPYNDPLPAESWALPEFKGYFGHVRRFEILGEGAGIRFELFDRDLFARWGTPRRPAAHLAGYSAKAVEYTFPPFPEGDVSILVAIPPIGNKFCPADDGSPQGRPNVWSEPQYRIRLRLRPVRLPATAN
ncbi:MAG: glycoside hydrolase family 2 [Kiritimatiellae bacterium]|nr:glycoside hydrolase family 2 [Kiritimatiellia bacterium]